MKLNSKNFSKTDERQNRAPVKKLYFCSSVKFDSKMFITCVCAFGIILKSIFLVCLRHKYWQEKIFFINVYLILQNNIHFRMNKKK